MIVMVVRDQKVRDTSVESLPNVLNDQLALVGRRVGYHDSVVKNGHDGPIRHIVLECQVVEILEARYWFNDLESWQCSGKRPRPEQVLSFHALDLTALGY